MSARAEFRSAYRAWRMIWATAQVESPEPVQHIIHWQVQQMPPADAAQQAACKAICRRGNGSRYNGIQSWPPATRPEAINNALRCRQIAKYGYPRTPRRIAA